MAGMLILMPKITALKVAVSFCGDEFLCIHFPPSLSRMDLTAKEPLAIRYSSIILMKCTSTGCMHC